MKIKHKILISFGSLPIFFVVIIGLIYGFIASRSLEERVGAQLESVSIIKKNQFNNFINDVRGEIIGMASDKSFTLHLSEFDAKGMLIEIEDQHKKFKEILKDRVGYESNFFEFFIIDNNNKIHLSTDEEQGGKFKSSEPYYIKGKTGAYVQYFYFDSSLQKPAITVSAPIKNEAGEVIGVLAGRVNLDNISEIMSERSGLGETGETYLANKFNLIVTETKSDPGAVFQKTIYTEGVKNCLNKKSGYARYLGPKNIAVAGRYNWLPESEICLLAEISEVEAFAPIRKFKLTEIYISLVAAFFAIIISSLFAGKLTRSILTLRDMAKEIGKGNFDTKVEIKAKDEIGELAREFNQMANEIKKSRAEKEKYSHDLEKQVEERTKELSAKVDELEKFSSLTVDRELKMVELKEKIKELKKKLDNNAKDTSRIVSR